MQAAKRRVGWGLRGRAACVALFPLAATACSTGNFLTSLGPDAGPPETERDARASDATPDHSAPKDARADHTSPNDAGVADGHHDAPTGASDAAPDGSGHGCTFTGEPTGTVDTLVAAPGSVTLQDFDIDCDDMFFTTSAGHIVSCPATGCGPVTTTLTTTVSAIDDGGVADSYHVRITTDGLVFTESGGAGATKGFDLFSLPRTGGAAKLLTHVTVAAACPCGYSIDSLAVVGNDVFYVATQTAPDSATVSLAAVVPTADGGALSQFTLFGAGPGGAPSYRGPATLSGALYYETIETPAATHPTVSTLTALGDGGTTATTYMDPPLAAARAIAASATFVAISGPALGDGGTETIDSGTGVADFVDAGGASALYVCAVGTPCTHPIVVSGVDARTISSLYADRTTLYFTDATNDLFACALDAALLGACTPALVAYAVPTFTELRSDTDNVYLLKSDGSAILRIAR